MKTYLVEYDGNGIHADGEEIARFDTLAEALAFAEQCARENRGHVDFKGGTFDVVEMEDDTGGTVAQIPVE